MAALESGPGLPPDRPASGHDESPANSECSLGDRHDGCFQCLGQLNLVTTGHKDWNERIEIYTLQLHSEKSSARRSSL